MGRKAKNEFTGVSNFDTASGLILVAPNELRWGCSGNSVLRRHVMFCTVSGVLELDSTGFICWPVSKRILGQRRE
eukprot:scaffold190360_cov57-Attheya_sp.AAC.1